MCGSAHTNGDEDVFVTSLTFEMEPDCYGEEDVSPRNLTQIPIEGLLDEFNLFVTDFYEQLNETSETICYQEFGSFDLAVVPHACGKERSGEELEGAHSG